MVFLKETERVSGQNKYSLILSYNYFGINNIYIANTYNNLIYTFENWVLFLIQTVHLVDVF